MHSWICDSPKPGHAGRQFVLRMLQFVSPTSSNGSVIGTRIGRTQAQWPQAQALAEPEPSDSCGRAEGCVALKRYDSGVPSIPIRATREFFRPAAQALFVLLVSRLQPAIDDVAEAAQHEIRHGHHQVDAVTIGAGLLRGVLILRTGGCCQGGRSGRARAGGARERQAQKGRQDRDEPKPFHCLSTAQVTGEPLIVPLPAARDKADTASSKRPRPSRTRRTRSEASSARCAHAGPGDRTFRRTP